VPAYFSATVEEFVRTPRSEIRARLDDAYSQDGFNFLYTTAFDAWRNELEILQQVLGGLSERNNRFKPSQILLEFWIPRRLRRADAIVLLDGKIVVLEFKSGDSNPGLTQVEDYALDLADFHEPSMSRLIFPIVIADRLKRKPFVSGQQVQPPQVVEPAALAEALVDICNFESGIHSPLSAETWENGRYKPVPTVLEAARAMFAEMEVREIANADTDAQNLTKTIDALRDVVANAATDNQKVICFVTGVPGAGKTLAGLRLVHDADIAATSSSCLAFLSGNGPLVKILQTSLSEDQRERRRLGLRVARRSPSTLIQGVYGFKKTYLADSEAPEERIIVFDEAQRAWNREKNAKMLKAPKTYPFSEPALILEIMARHSGWCVIVALIGGGQEIHDGEAGLEEWGRSLADRTKQWKVFSSPEAIEGGAATARSKLFSNGIPHGLDVAQDSALHLDNPTRQYRGKTIAKWVNSVLNGEATDAKNILAENPRYPVVLTRDLADAREWLKRKARGSERIGLVASSGAGRLRAYGIETDNSFHKGIPIHHWFLRSAADYRSSHRLEVATTEFEIQGLELDWVGVCWGGDLLWDEDSGEWRLLKLSGSKWTPEKNQMNRRYTTNTYRVLLTRARQGMVIFVPPGDSRDETLQPAGYDATANHLLGSGVSLLK
jgi:hypothetical protein